MKDLSAELLLIAGSALVVMSYFFSMASKYIRIPSVLLLLLAGIVARLISESQGWNIIFPEHLVEMLGSVGLIMIVLEAGLDLKLGRNKLKLVRNSFFAALVIFLITAAGVSMLLHYWLHESIVNCIVYAIPLSIMSSSIVIPSLHHLTEAKQEFLVYEASFSDILGILAFNYFTGNEIFSAKAAGMFFLNIVIAFFLSLLFSILLFVIITRSKLKVRFFLIFALLLILYEGGKLLGLPSLIIILVFGMLMNNWGLVKIRRINDWFPREKVEETTLLLHSLTAESSFLIRTFFFILFGFSIDMKAALQHEVMLIGTALVLILFLSRYLYLRFFLKESVYPEVMFIPRGLITIVLFYKIPAAFHLASFNNGILFFVILVSGLIMMLGMIFYKKKTAEISENG
jgi:Kef-type K+ transport system membrane component KefB